MKIIYIPQKKTAKIFFFWKKKYARVEKKLSKVKLKSLEIPFLNQLKLSSFSVLTTISIIFYYSMKFSSETNFFIPIISIEKDTSFIPSAKSSFNIVGNLFVNL